MTTPLIDKIGTGSVQNLVGKNQQVMVYGLGNAWRRSVELVEANVQRLFLYTIGDDTENGLVEDRTKLDGIQFKQFPSRSDEGLGKGKYMKRKCKAGLLNWAFETWKRKDSPEQIPLIFTLDSNHHYSPNAENMLSRTKEIMTKEGMEKANDLVTHAEIRRLYKLCTDERVDPEVRAAVQRNVIFTHINGNEEQRNWALERVDAPWEDPAWKAELAKRKEAHMKVDKDHDWREELNAAVASERSNRARQQVKKVSLWDRFVSWFKSFFR